MSYTQLTQDERYHIQYLSRHCTVTEIAKQLNRHKSTIRRKLSPEQVCAYLHKHHGITLHHSTIYRYLRQDKKQQRHFVATPQNMQQTRLRGNDGS